MDYKSFLNQKPQQLKESGAYRYFLEVNKSAQHFPDFYYADEQGQQHAAVNWCRNDYLRKNIPGFIFFSDERNHASIIEGIRGCKNEKKIFRDNDIDHLEELLRSVVDLPVSES